MKCSLNNNIIFSSSTIVVKCVRRDLNPRMHSMALFVPFRALGLVTDGDTPFVTQRRGSETFITTSVGTSWQVRLCIRNIERHVGHANEWLLWLEWIFLIVERVLL